MKIICLEDSFTQGYLVENKNYTRFLKEAGFLVRNLGVNGSFTEEMLDRYKRFKKEEKDDILIVFGSTNDFLNGVSTEFAYQNLKSILDISKAARKILIIPPYIEEESAYIIYEGVNRKIDLLYKMAKESIKEPHIEIVDARGISGRYIDGIHLASDFHEKLAKEVIKKIND